MAKEDETPRTNPAEIESLIEQIRGTNLDPRAKDKVERLLRTVLTLVELLQPKHTSIKKLREMIFSKRTERHRARKAEGREKVDEFEKSDDNRPKAAGDQDARAELRAIESGRKSKWKGPGRHAASDYSGAKIVKCRHEGLKAGDDCPASCGGWLYEMKLRVGKSLCRVCFKEEPDAAEGNRGHAARVMPDILEIEKILSQLFLRDQI